MKLAKYLVALLLILMFAGCSETVNSNNPSIVKGKLDLGRQWDFNADGNVKLDGEWEFYWSQLYNYSDLEGITPDLIAGVPNTWNAYSLNGVKLPGEGYATYRLHVTTNLPEGTMLGILMHTFSSAYRLYINESLIATNGRVATIAAEEIGEYKPQAVFFSLPASEFDIIIQVSNFHYARGGFWYSLSMGDAVGILKLHDSMLLKEAFILGALLIISLFFIAIFILRPELNYTLYFGLLCICTIAAVDMVGQFIIPRIFPCLSFNAVVFVWYTSTTLVLFLLILFVHDLYRSKISGFILKTYLLIYVMLQFLYVFTAPAYYSRFAYLSNYIDITGVLCAVIIVAIGIKRGDKIGWLNVTSMFIILVTYIHDILYLTNIINSSFEEIFYVGLFLFMFIQMVIQALRIKLFHEHEIAAELVSLQAQIKPHFLYNAMNTFISISFYDIDKARNLLTDFSHYLRRSFDLKDLSQFTPLKNEMELAKAYVEIEKARFEERIEVTFDVPEDLEVKVPNLMIQPMIENAIIHGILPKPEGGRVNVAVKRECRMITFIVKDNGVGMTSDKLARILKHDAGKGVGLVNVNKRLRKLFGKGLNINSSPETGTEITWSIPV